MYDTIKNNILKNFLNRNYLWTCIVRKEALFEDMTDRSPFPFNYDYDKDVLMVNLGNDINVSFNFKWDTHQNGASTQYHLVKIY
jgi:hypothetical protein